MLLLVGLWLAAPMSEIGLVLILVLATLGLARWRFPLPVWTTLADQAACAAVAVAFWPDAALAFALPVFDSFLAARPGYSLPALAALFLLRAWSLPVAAAVAAAALAGLGVHLWRRQLREARSEADQDRRERYDLESLKGELLSANVRIARMAEVAERARIARDLHDHAGHEIAAAALALEAYRGLADEGDPQAAGLLDEARRRFTACPVAFAVHGDTAAVPVHAWAVLEPCLKEALTNASRHEAPSMIDVSLDVGPHIVRLCVHNPQGGLPYRPARGSVPGAHGLGLRNLAQRARAVGGSIATDTRDGFRLICVLPLGNGTIGDGPFGNGPPVRQASEAGPP